MMNWGFWAGVLCGTIGGISLSIALSIIGSIVWHSWLHPKVKRAIYTKRSGLHVVRPA